MASISCQHIYKIYPGATAPSVTDFNLEIQDKEFIIFVGPSGCGKSTTLRMIAGLEDITSGELWIGDKLMNDVEPKDRDIAMVFQNYALYPHMTVYENMAFSLKLKKLCRSVFAVRREWDKDATRDETFKHFGYENVHAPKHGTGCWANDGETIPRNIQELPEALELIVEPNEKVRIIFDYDPNFPRALFQCVRWPADEKQITESEYTSTPEG